MNCDDCKSNLATTKFSQITGAKLNHFNLCDDCVKSRGLDKTVTLEALMRGDFEKSLIKENEAEDLARH